MLTNTYINEQQATARAYPRISNERVHVCLHLFEASINNYSRKMKSREFEANGRMPAMKTSRLDCLPVPFKSLVRIFFDRF